MCTSWPSTNVDEPRIGPLVVCTTSLSIIPCTWHTLNHNHRMQNFNIFLKFILPLSFRHFFFVAIVLIIHFFLCYCCCWLLWVGYCFTNMLVQQMLCTFKTFFSSLFIRFHKQKSDFLFKGWRRFVLISHAYNFIFLNLLFLWMWFSAFFLDEKNDFVVEWIFMADWMCLLFSNGKFWDSFQQTLRE